MSEVTRFDLEQDLLRCWTITSDLKTFADRNVSAEDYKALAAIYDIHFDKLWAVFEQMIREGKIQ